ncbi:MULTISPECIES: glutamyl-tRNA reductase [Cellvibrio]|jgi:glutamyl-tRNA reductase|uniref:Glutamyl-tRNA reductase n=1 Tax=Cellvibrio fibrivorans TaxID=126350 RepID=A0ABU1UZ82_9GAMM|nr:glutamyl-tRNA reductase [Cellvibrio fibrivorans]MDR7090509.1 glutamyl-tRNA reductase [Cellvibrio fibrivorans]
MTLLAFGINHTTAPLALRERVAFAPENLQGAMQEACAHAGLTEVAILSTCNRTEIYAASESDATAIQQWLVDHTAIEAADLANSYYCYQDHEAVRHMMKVAGGLDSLVLGEPQILGQMKSAFAVAKEAGTLGAELHATFQQVFNIAKRVRTETAIGENPVSVAYAAVSLAQQIFSNLKQDTALLIGAGETIELVARHLAEQGIKHIIVANRTLDRAQRLAREFNGEAILLADIPEQLHRADIVISSTASQLPLLGKGAVESALKKRKHKPMFMLDIAVPRDIEEQVGELDDVYLYTVDDLHAVIDENKKSRVAAADQAEEIINEGVELFLRHQRALSAVETVKAYRNKAEQMRDLELQKALRSLQTGVNPEQVLQQFARNLTNKLIHSPTAVLKEASASSRHHVIQVAQELFELSVNPAADISSDASEQ